jgi:hypothetical protein
VAVKAPTGLPVEGMERLGEAIQHQASGRDDVGLIFVEEAVEVAVPSGIHVLVDVPGQKADGVAANGVDGSLSSRDQAGLMQRQEAEEGPEIGGDEEADSLHRFSLS